MSVNISCEPEDEELAQKVATQLEKYIGKNFIYSDYEENFLIRIESVSEKVNKKITQPEYGYIDCIITVTEIQTSKDSPVHLLFMKNEENFYVLFSDIRKHSPEHLDQQIKEFLCISNAKEISDQMFNAFYKKVNSLHNAFLIVSNSILSDKKEEK